MLINSRFRNHFPNKLQTMFFSSRESIRKLQLFEEYWVFRKLSDSFLHCNHDSQAPPDSNLKIRPLIFELVDFWNTNALFLLALEDFIENQGVSSTQWNPEGPRKPGKGSSFCGASVSKLTYLQLCLVRVSLKVSADKILIEANTLHLNIMEIFLLMGFGFLIDQKWWECF